MLPFKSNAPVQPVKLYIIIFGLSDRQKGISYPQIGPEKNVVLRVGLSVVGQGYRKIHFLSLVNLETITYMV